MVEEDERENFALIRFLNKVYQLDRQTWGHPIAAVLVRTILEGELQNRPHDYTSLAAATGLPVATVDRRVNALLAEGMVARVRVGRSYRLSVTETSRRRSRHQEEAAIRALHDLTNALDAPYELFGQGNAGGGSLGNGQSEF
jgi:predicted transcriptional regulator